ETTLATLTMEQATQLSGYGFNINGGIDTNATVNVVIGSAGNSSLSGGSSNDIFLGGSGHEFLSGGAGNDLLIGGAGNDQLNGGTGNNSYRFGWGDGQDVIQHVYTPSADSHNVLQ